MLEHSIEQALQCFFSDLPNVERLLVAFSGGVDSHVLLHALHTQFNHLLPIAAIHINHGINAQADAWEQHVRQVCQSLNVPCYVLRITVNKSPGESLEALARQARYSALASFLSDSECLLTAHQQNDQAETLLLQLFRGAGVSGLAAMPPLCSFSRGYLARPLLVVSRTQVMQYAEQHGLSWIEDDSNQQLQFDRNYLRSQLMPVLQQRWPGYLKTITRSSRHCADADVLLTELASIDFAVAVAEVVCGLQVSVLTELSVPRMINLLRYWLVQQQLPIPNEKHLLQIVHEVIFCAVDAAPCVTWPGCEIRRYQNIIYAMPPLAPHDATQVIPWDLQGSLQLAEGRQELHARQVVGKGITVSMLVELSELTIRYRHFGERLQPQGRCGSHPLKKLFQEWLVPPWQRDRLPLLYYHNELIAVIGYAIAAKYAAGSDELGWVIEQELM